MSCGGRKLRRARWLLFSLAVILPLASCGDGGNGKRGKADLTVVTFIHSVSGTTVNYAVTVGNPGKVDSSSFRVDLYYDRVGAPAPGTPGDDSQIVASVARSGVQTLNFIRTATPPGTTTAWVQVDTLDDVAESDEGNNTAGPITVTVTTPPAVDLAVTGFTHSVSGSDVTYFVDVTNVGGAAAGSFSVDLYYDRATAPPTSASGDDAQVILSLAPAATQNLIFSQPGAPPGSTLAWVQADTFDVEAEADETNNVAGPLAVSVGSSLPDLVITSLASSVSGTTVTYIVDVANPGPVAAGSFSVDLYYDLGSAPAPGAAGDDASVIGSLGAGANTMVSFTRPSTPPGNYSSWAQVDTFGAVVEGDETNNVAGPEGVTVTAEADLVITGFSSTVTGTTVDYTVDITNQGGTPAGSFSVDLYYDLAGAPTGGAAGDDATIVAGLGVGANTTVPFTRSSTPPGNYLSWAQVDTFDAVAEGNEGNNVAGPEAVTVATQADLVITSLTATVTGDTVDYSVAVTNQGGTDAGSFSLDLYYDLGSAPAPAAAGDDATIVPGLGAGASTTVPFTRSSTPVGNYDSWAQVDTFDTVPEMDEGNNVSGPEVVTVIGTIDLTITSFTSSVTGQRVDYAVQVTNQGTAPAGSFSVDLYYDLTGAPSGGTPGDDATTVPGLGAGASTVVPFVRTSTPPANYLSWAQVDTFDAVAEADENNNVAGPETVMVVAPDLVITSFTSTVVSQTVDYSVEVTNQGTGAAGTCSLDLYYDLASAPAPMAAGDVAAAVPALGPGASTTIPFTRAATPIGSYTSWAQVDTYDVVAEGDELNNVAGPEVVNVGPGLQADLVVTAFSAQLNGSDITYDIDVTNQGTGAAGSFSVDLYYHLAAAPTGGTPGDDAIIVPSLAPSVTTNIVMVRSGTPAGTYDSWVMADTFDAVAESDELNNVAGPETVTVTPSPSDLIISSFGAQVSGTDVTYTVEVTNQGGTDVTGFFTVDVYWDRAGPPPVLLAGDQLDVIVTLGAGQSQTIVFPTRTGTPSGNYSSWAQVDTFEDISEGDETNNVDGPLPVNVP